MDTFADKLDRLMLLHGYTQASLGEALNVSHVAVGNWLKGAKPRSQKMREIAGLFGVELKVLKADTEPLRLVPTQSSRLTYQQKDHSSLVIMEPKGQNPAPNFPDIREVMKSAWGEMKAIDACRERKEKLDRLDQAYANGSELCWRLAGERYKNAPDLRVDYSQALREFWSHTITPVIQELSEK